jgi:hypothetical protein
MRNDEAGGSTYEGAASAGTEPTSLLAWSALSASMPAAHPRRAPAVPQIDATDTRDIGLATAEVPQHDALLVVRTPHPDRHVTRRVKLRLAPTIWDDLLVCPLIRVDMW